MNMKQQLPSIPLKLVVGIVFLVFCVIGGAMLLSSRIGMPNFKQYIFSETNADIEIGVTKQDFFAAYPDSVKFKNTGFALGENFIEEFDMGPDCWTIDAESYTCFKDDKIFVVAGQHKLGFLIDERRNDLLYSLDYTDPNTCANLDDLPFFVGYPSKSGCYGYVAQHIKDVEVCKLVMKARVEENPNYSGRYGYEPNCFLDIIKETNTPDLCSLFEFKDLRNRCFRLAAGWSSDISLCEGIEPYDENEKYYYSGELDSESEYKRCLGAKVAR